MNKFKEDEPALGSVFRIDDSIRQLQINKLTQLKAERDNHSVQICLANLKTAAEGNGNLMPFILSAVEAYSTLGEIADVLREVFGEY